MHRHSRAKGSKPSIFHEYKGLKQSCSWAQPGYLLGVGNGCSRCSLPVSGAQVWGETAFSWSTGQSSLLMAVLRKVQKLLPDDLTRSNCLKCSTFIEKTLLPIRLQQFWKEDPSFICSRMLTGRWWRSGWVWGKWSWSIMPRDRSWYLCWRAPDLLRLHWRCPKSTVITPADACNT